MKALLLRIPTCSLPAHAGACSPAQGIVGAAIQARLLDP